MLMGVNPFDMISEDPLIHKHSREYTIDELVAICSEAGLVITKVYGRNYFGVNSIRQKIFCFLGGKLSSNWRDGITLILQKRSTSQTLGVP